jgi:hypothetical protein
MSHMSLTPHSSLLTPADMAGNRLMAVPAEAGYPLKQLPHDLLQVSWALGCFRHTANMFLLVLTVNRLLVPEWNHLTAAQASKP